MPTPTKERFPLYSLVLVQDPMGFAYVGEVLSRPTPENTLMVRNTPNDPCLLRELPISILQRSLLPKHYKWIQYARVSGRGQFPVDMLRYDVCAPANFSLHNDDPLGRITIGIEYEIDKDALFVSRAVARKNQEWTVARWASFGWRVEPLPKMTQQYIHAKP